MTGQDDKTPRPDDQNKDRSGDRTKKQDHAVVTAGQSGQDKDAQKPGQPIPGQQPPAKPNDDPSKRTPERQAGQQQKQQPDPARR